MEKFFLPSDKKQQTHIVDAALMVFGRNGYKKSSISDIAETAGVSKSVIFYYFGNKKSLYLYLAKLCGSYMVEQLAKVGCVSNNDFFDRIRMISDNKLAVMKMNPGMMPFLKSMYYEKDTNVAADIEKMYREIIPSRNDYILKDIDLEKFKEGVNPELVLKFLIWAAEGFASSIPADRDIDGIDADISDFQKCLDIMREHFYKDEYI